MRICQSEMSHVFGNTYKEEDGEVSHQHHQYITKCYKIAFGTPHFSFDPGENDASRADCLPNQADPKKEPQSDHSDSPSCQIHRRRPRSGRPGH